MRTFPMNICGDCLSQLQNYICRFCNCTKSLGFIVVDQMATFLAMERTALPALLAAHFSAAAAADAGRPGEERAATVIQAGYRGWRER
jgi:hypothetical protein